MEGLQALLRKSHPKSSPPLFGHFGNGKQGPGQKSAQQCNFEQKLFWVPQIEGHPFQLGFHFNSCDLLLKIGLTDIHHCE